MLNYHALTQGKSESGAEFVDRELREYLALRDMGVQIDDSIRLTNSSSRILLIRSTNSLLRLFLRLLVVLLPCLRLTILHLDLQRLQQLQRSMHLCVDIAKEKTTKCRIALRKSQFPIRRGLKNPMRLHQLSPVQLNASGSLVQSVTLWITCRTCVLVVRK